jgi:hypothetical protein
MANQFGIPQEEECRLREKFKDCAYCRQPMKEHLGVLGCPSDKATIEHLNRHGPFYWKDGLLEADLVLCCGSCNSSRGTKRLFDWFKSPYCVQKGITASTVADEVKWYLRMELPENGTRVRAWTMDRTLEYDEAASHTPCTKEYNMTNAELARTGLHLLQHAILVAIREHGPLRPMQVKRLLTMPESECITGVTLAVMKLMVHDGRLRKDDEGRYHIID